MVITDLKVQVKNPNRASVFVDRKYSFSLTIEQLADSKLKSGQELSEADLKRLKKLSEDGKLKYKVLEWLMVRPHSERELRDYLFRKKIEKEQIEEIVDWAKAKGYQDDTRFTRWFVELRLRKNKSLRAVESELKSKGISSVTIQSILSEVGGLGRDEESLSKLIEKLLTKSRYQDEKKLIAYLIGKGFKYSDVKEALADRT